MVNWTSRSINELGVDSLQKDNHRRQQQQQQGTTSLNQSRNQQPPFNMSSQLPTPVDPDLFTRVTFKIQTSVQDIRVNQAVAIIGDVSELGCWNVKGSVELSNTERTDSHLVWTACVTFPTSLHVNYKYIIVNKARNPALLVEWEAARGSSRSINVEGKDMFVNDGIFGMLGSGLTPWIGRGWLPDYETQLRILLQVDEKPVVLYDEESHPDIVLRLHDPYGLSQDFSLPMTSFAELVLHAPTLDCLGFSASIVEYKDGASIGGNGLGGSNSPSSPTNVNIVGRSFIISQQVRNKWGKIYSPIISPDGLVVGEFRCNYLVVTPFTHPLNSIGSLWRSIVERNPQSIIGHRGNGKNNFGINTNAVTENTILSFLTATRFGAKMIEFDLQLTYDNVPVIFHDYEIEIETSEGVTMKETINRLTLEQFLKLKPQKGNKGPLSKGMSHMKGNRLSRSTGDLLQLLPQSVFPTFTAVTSSSTSTTTSTTTTNTNTNTHATDLTTSTAVLHPSPTGYSNVIHDRYSTFQDSFTFVPQDVGFMVEIKYPNIAMQNLRKFTAPERNEFVDIILNVVFNEAGDRKIVFLTFDPDIAMLLRTKQFRYPVLFLVCSDTPTFYSVFDPDVNVNDTRGNSILNAISFVKIVNLDGIVCDSESILANHSFVETIHRENLLIFTYGSKNVDPVNVKIQTDLGVDGIIADNMTKLSKRLKEQCTSSASTAALV
ncbi:hypothetical protein DFA_11693 [Cavenderia fasciculata]|uniref:Uncharacterized protein n=1 Tax=Cavenderia fasciculata TaxID=261658 RepID=F4QDY5_CACFS|nr:uncharacterized protein DFA_11693 [Cavenderia fasciculata]EGG13932.1 hypothetical protein DFA_11693 [Cavenderia fasciculata]|eukprot:XP_004350640.1 hypothetical protein DFA_11693 [Cavenderia fasciculata]